MANREIEAILKISSKLGSMRALKTLETELGKVDRQAKAFNRSQGLIATGASAAGRSIITGLAGFATVSAVSSAVTRFASVERRLNYIAINAGQGKDAIRGMLGEVNDLSERYATSQDEVTAGLEKLVARGEDYKNAMAFLPSVVATSRATGAAVDEVADTAFTLGSNFHIAAGEMQKAFDILDTSGKDGAFELKDMAHELPKLVPAFAALGYKGTEGLKKLASLMQTVRMQTATSSDAATNLLNVLQKMETRQTANAFKKMGVDLPAAMAAARKNGDDLINTFVKLTEVATHGDLSKITQLFQDAEVQQGVRAIIMGEKSLSQFFADLNDAKVNGAVMKDVNQVLSDTQTKVDRLSSSWMKFMLAIGGAASDAGAPDALNFVAHAFEDNSAVQDAMKNRGYGWLHRHLLTPSVTEYRQLLRESGKVLPGEEDLAKAVPDAYHILGHRPQRPHSRVTSDMMPAAPPAAPVLLPPMPAGGFLGPAERKLGIAAPSASDLAAGGAQAKDSMAAGGRAVEEAGRQAGNSIVEAARQAARIISDALAGAARGGGLASLHPVNADVGKSDVP